MKPFADQISHYLHHELGSDIDISLDTCFGACDIKYDHFKATGVHTIIHFGNVEIPNLDKPKHTKVIFVPLYLKVSPNKMLHKAHLFLSERRIKSIGLISSIQMMHNLETSKNFFIKHGYQVHIGQGNSRVTHPGHVLGCNSTAATNVANKVEMFVMLEDGSFHAKPVALSTQKDVACFDPVSQKLYYYDYQKLKSTAIKERTENLSRLRRVKRIAFLVSTKQGQNRTNIMEKVRQKYVEAGYQVTTLSTDYLDINALNRTNFDLVISTLCPRVAMDERKQFTVPIITYSEAVEFIAKGKINQHEFQFDQIN
jgi:2-(3-amino-3-carboxypropyl)histidine synthase